jgi:hypothetical protein
MAALDHSPLRFFSLGSNPTPPSTRTASWVVNWDLIDWRCSGTQFVRTSLPVHSQFAGLDRWNSTHISFDDYGSTL